MNEQILSAHPRSLFEGFAILTSGFEHSFKNKKLFFLAFSPVLITIICLFLFYFPLFTLVLTLLEQKLISSESFGFWGGGLLLWLVNVLVKILAAVFSFIVFYILLQIVYIPFCSLLAEMILRQRGILEVKGLSGMLSYNLSMLRVGLLKAVLLVFVGLVLFASSFLPFLSFLPFYFALLVFAYDSFDYGLELYGCNLNQRSTFFKKEFFMINGHASVLFLLSFVPGLLLLTLPFSVVGASLKLGEIYDVKRKLA